MPGSRTGSGSGNPEKPDRALVPDDNRGVYGQINLTDVPDPDPDPDGPDPDPDPGPLFGM